MTNAKLKNAPTSSDAEIAKAISNDQAVVASNITPGDVAAAAETQALTALSVKTIDAGVECGMIHLASAFEEMEQRTVGSNGKAYPLSYEFGEEVEDTGEIVVVNRFSFIQSRVLESVVDALDYQAASMAKSIEETEKGIALTRRSMDNGRSATTEQALARRIEFLQQKEEQLFILQRAFAGAKSTYYLATGHEYSTRAERKALADARKVAHKADGPVVDRSRQLAERFGA